MIYCILLLKSCQRSKLNFPITKQMHRDWDAFVCRSIRKHRFRSDKSVQKLLSRTADTTEHRKQFHGPVYCPDYVIQKCDQWAWCTFAAKNSGRFTREYWLHEAKCGRSVSDIVYISFYILLTINWCQPSYHATRRSFKAVFSSTKI